MTSRELKEFKAALKAFHDEHTKTPEQARKILREEGVIDKRGNLKKPYSSVSTKKLAKVS